MSKAQERKAMRETLAGYSLMGLDSVAAFVGVPVGQVVRWVHDGAVPCLKLGPDPEMWRIDPLDACVLRICGPGVSVDSFFGGRGEEAGWATMRAAQAEMPKVWAPDPAPGVCFIYLIETAEGLPRVKIGYSNNPEARMAALATASPVALRLRACWPGTRDDELRLHELASAHRVVGEWFTVEAIGIVEAAMKERDRS